VEAPRSVGLLLAFARLAIKAKPMTMENVPSLAPHEVFARPVPLRGVPRDRVSRPLMVFSVRRNSTSILVRNLNPLQSAELRIGDAARRVPGVTALLANPQGFAEGTRRGGVTTPPRSG
jgi:hypothetical protein